MDALYASTRKEAKAYEDFSQLYIDFNILEERKVAEKFLFVNSVELSANDVRHRGPDEDRILGNRPCCIADSPKKSLSRSIPLAQ